MNRPSHFDIHATDPEKVAKFYTDVFGWEIKKWDGQMGGMDYWMVMTGKQGEPGGLNGGLMKRMGPAPEAGAAVTAFVCTVVVDNYEEYDKKIVAAGGSVALPKMAIAGMAWQGYYKDCDGNLFGLHQADKEAK